jgi:hypothetical protein
MEINKNGKVYLGEIYIDDLEELGYNWGYDTIQVTNGSFRHLVTLSVIEKWLREEMGVFIEVLWKFTNPNAEWYAKIFYKGTFYETKLRPRYEQAQGDAIVKAIDLIKKQKIKDANVVPSIY